MAVLSTGLRRVGAGSLLVALAMPFAGTESAAARGRDGTLPVPLPLEDNATAMAQARANPSAPGIAKREGESEQESVGPADTPTATASPAELVASTAATSAPIAPTWVQQGPAPTVNGQAEGLTAQQNPVTGAVNAIVTDPASADAVYVGTVNGGVWKTTNATVSSPTWTPLTDTLPSLAISDLAMSPVNSSILYAGTGSFSSGG